MTDDESEYDGVDTDWVANIPRLGAYGFGYTKDQALTAAARHASVDPESDTDVQIQFAEHIGSLTVGLQGISDIDTLVGGETVEIAESELYDLKDLSIKANGEADRVLGDAETLEEYDGDGD